MNADAEASLANQHLIRSLTEYKPTEEADTRSRDFILNFVQTHTHPFNRSHLHAHLTGSALIVSADGTRVLLGFHRKLGKWLQMGGHGDPGETEAECVAMREANEESGIADLYFHPSAPRPFDVDVHRIPARETVPEHLHLDLRYLVVAPDGAIARADVEEQEAVSWFSWQDALKLELDESLVRAIQKTLALLQVPERFETTDRSSVPPVRST